MPELPDIAVYCESIEGLLQGARLTRIALPSVFVLRTVTPPATAFEGRELIGAERIGKRIVLVFEGDHFAVIHLMIAGRLKWLPGSASPRAGKQVLAMFEFDRGCLVLTEAGTKRRASLHLLQGRAALAAHDPGGADPMSISEAAFAAILQRENHTLKRALTDPHFLSGIGNAYSDEILHRAQLSPLALTQKLSAEQLAALYLATRAVLAEWLARLRAEAAGGFPERVTAFHPGMAVHGKFRQPCPVCGELVQRIVYADNESNYCPRCQTGGKLLADRALSRLLKASWPKRAADL